MRRVIVTGAAGGIGSAAVAELRARGARVVGLDVLIDNAGVGTPQRAGGAPDAAALAVIDVGLEGRVPVERVADAARTLARAPLGPPPRHHAQRGGLLRAAAPRSAPAARRRAPAPALRDQAPGLVAAPLQR